MSHWFRDFANILNENLQDEVDAYSHEPEVLYEEESTDVRGTLHGNKPIPTLAMNVKEGDLIGLSPEAYVNSDYGSVFDSKYTGQNRYIQGVVDVHVDGRVTHIKFNSNKEATFPSDFEVLVFGSGWHDMKDSYSLQPKIEEDFDIDAAIKESFSFTNITESVDFHPAQLEIENGQKHIGWPAGGTKKIKVPCYGCEYYHEHHPDQKINPHCEDCGGTGFTTETEYLFPMMNVSNRNAQVISQMLGIGDEDHGWVPYEDLPLLKRKLIRIMNSDKSEHTIAPSTTSNKTTYVDRSGSVPEIKTQGGATMIDAGLGMNQIQSYADRLMKMVDWAQEHKCGISWA